MVNVPLCVNDEDKVPVGGVTRAVIALILQTIDARVHTVTASHHTLTPSASATQLHTSDSSSGGGGLTVITARRSTSGSTFGQNAPGVWGDRAVIAANFGAPSASTTQKLMASLEILVCSGAHRGAGVDPGMRLCAVASLSLALSRMDVVDGAIGEDKVHTTAVCFLPPKCFLVGDVGEVFIASADVKVCCGL